MRLTRCLKVNNSQQPFLPNRQRVLEPEQFLCGVCFVGEFGTQYFVLYIICCFLKLSNTMKLDLFEKVLVTQLLQKYLAFYRNWRFVKPCKRHWTVLWTRCTKHCLQFLICHLHATPLIVITRRVKTRKVLSVQLLFRGQKLYSVLYETLLIYI
jgi:hypothetical protein